MLARNSGTDRITRILFIHQNSPGQFKLLAAHLAQQPGNQVASLEESANVCRQAGLLCVSGSRLPGTKEDPPAPLPRQLRDGNTPRSGCGSRLRAAVGQGIRARPDNRPRGLRRTVIHQGCVSRRAADRLLRIYLSCRRRRREFRSGVSIHRRRPFQAAHPQQYATPRTVGVRWRQQPNTLAAQHLPRTRAVAHPGDSQGIDLDTVRP